MQDSSDVWEGTLQHSSSWVHVVTPGEGSYPLRVSPFPTPHNKLGEVTLSGLEWKGSGQTLLDA